MKCRNCYTGLMSTDTRCPACGAATPLDRAAAASLEMRAAIDPAARRELSRLIFVRALVMIGTGLALGVGAAWVYFSARSAPARASTVTAADLLRVHTPEALPEWVSYSPARVIDTRVEYVKLHTRQTTKKFVLLAVGDRWLLAMVSPRYNGGRVEGRLTGIDGVALPKVRAGFPEQAAFLLPYQIDANIDLDGSRRGDYFLGALGGGFGLLLLVTGAVHLVSRPAGPALPPRRPDPPATPATPFPAPPADPRPAAPRRRSRVVRALVGVAWAAVLFVAAVVVTSVVSTLRARGDVELGKQLAGEAGRTLGPWMLMGSVVLAAVLGYRGWLPGTRR